VRIAPRYEGPPLVQLPSPAGDPSVPLLRQRRRFGELLRSLDDDQWTAPTRCDEWKVRDLVAHLVTVDQYWLLSIGAGLAGTPTRFLTSFDPVATPAQLVDAMQAPPSEVLDTFVTGVEQLADVLTGLDAAQWELLAESPPGHVPLHALVSHALWDAWIHERDVALPLGIEPAEEPDEIAVALAYAAALSPTFLAMFGSVRTGTLVVEGTDPDIRVVVELGTTVVVHDGDAGPDAVRVTGRSADLVDALSLRTPLPCPVDDAGRWMLSGLETAFDQAPA
jgi:uncharacterized protein (TIGR03083 family)